jgi:two-component system response regulator
MDTEVEVLLVEDNMSDATMTIRVLKKYNLANKLLHLKDGAAAVDFLLGQGEYEGRNTNQKPKLILLDLQMPKLNGIEVLRMIKNDERTNLIPVVILTSSKEHPDIKECYELGANSYTVKPVVFDDFQMAISNLGLYWLSVNHPPQQ